MASEYHPIDRTPPPQRGWLGRLIPLLLMFAAGAAAMGYALAHWSLAARTLGIGGQVATARSVPITVLTPAQPVVSPAAVALDLRQQQAVDAKLAGLEGRIGQINARAAAAAGNADRAEGLLVAFAARRALDRGVALGYIEALLRDRFGSGQPQAVATIITAAHQPVTLEELQGGLADAAPQLIGGGPDETWLDGLRREVASLVIVRRANVPSPDPADRVARARRQLDAGHVGAALAEVARMPGRDGAANWIAAARRYVAARDALDRIEAAALLEPRGLRRPVPAAPPAAPVEASVAEPTL